MRLSFFALAAALAVAGPLAGQTPAGPAGHAAKPIAELRARDAVILGSIVGLLEYLPVSSLGHAMVADHFLGLEDGTQLTNSRGEPLWARPPRAGRPGENP